MKGDYIKVVYNDEEDILSMVKNLKNQDIEIQDVLSPFPIHGLDKALGLKDSKIPTVGFICGGIGTIIAFGFQAWVFTVDYPLFIGGKPHLSIPAFIPVTFEITILLAAIGMVLAFLLRSKLGPGADNFIHDERTTDNKFLLIIAYNSTQEKVKINEIINSGPKSEIEFKEKNNNEIIINN